MIAVIKTGGKQYKVSPNQEIEVEKLDGQEGDKVVFGEVLLISDEKGAKIGAPVIGGAKVEGTILKQGRAEKIIVQKYKSKKRQHTKRGHRQHFSLVKIEAIK